MLGKMICTAAAFASLSSPCFAADKIKIGFITTLSGPQAVMGTQMKDSAQLALEMLGGKIGGLPAELIFGDDQQKPDVGRQLADRMLKRDRVDVISGLLASNILLALYPEVINSKTVMISANSGPHQVAGELCSPYFFSTASQNDQAPEAMGTYMNKAGLTDVYIMAPNYAAGKDMLAGFKRTFKGKLAGEVYTTFGQSDYQAEITQIRAAHPKAVFVFYPGGMGIQFVKQYAASGLKSDVPLYGVYTTDATNLAQLKGAALGNHDVSFWNADLPQDRSKAYVEAFRKKYGYTPANYGADSFDAMFLLDSAVRAVGGRLEDKKALITAMEKADFSSVRGHFEFNTNHFPIQKFYLLKVDGTADAPSLDIEQTITDGASDFYANECHMPSAE